MLVRPKAPRRPSRRSSRRTTPRRVRFEPLEPRTLLAGLPYGAVAQDTAEYMLGTVAVTVVLFESNGSIDPSTQNWNPLVRDDQGVPILDNNGRTISASGPNHIELTKDRVREGLQWWEDTLANFYARKYVGVDPIHSLNFVFDFQYAHNPIPTGYEPIDRISNDYALWVPDFLSAVGADDTGWIDIDIRTFNNQQRLKYDADWAFTIFVVNDYNDPDGRFKSGGSFSQAFAFSGGRFFVAPSRRPASTFAHESGHIFYALDEYINAGTYTSRRGYYNTQNLNAWDNPDPNYGFQSSIMNAGASLDAAWLNHTSSDSSLAMLGWQDSDGDGVFDVLDVPLSLSGSGYYDAQAQVYRFTGHSAVRTLPNVNSSGRRNDITINEVSQAVYSLDDGLTWLVARQYGVYETELTLALPLQPGQEILLRTQSVDPLTGRIVAMSDTVFWGTTAYPTTVAGPGVQGYVWYDKDSDGSWDAAERGVPGWTIQLVDAGGQPMELRQRLEPDDYAAYQLLNNTLSGVTLTATGYDVRDGRVGAVEATTAATGTKVLGAVRSGASDVWVTDWTADSRLLRIDFASPTTTLSIDAVAPPAGGYGRLEIYDAAGKLLGRYTTKLLEGSAVETMTLSVPAPEIAYAIVRAATDSAIRLDNLRVGPDSTVTTDATGAYELPYLPAGTYRVQAVPSEDWLVAAPLSGIQEVVVAADGKMVWDNGTARPSDFASVPSPTAPPWRNPIFALDVNDDQLLTPIDALLIINELNRNGARELPPPSGSQPPPYLDANGDNNVSPNDALRVINELNRRGSGGGGGESTASTVSVTSTAGNDQGSGEAEAWSVEPVSRAGEGRGTQSSRQSQARRLPADPQPPMLEADLGTREPLDRWATPRRQIARDARGIAGETVEGAQSAHDDLFAWLGRVGDVSDRHIVP